ncbi:hypothetical protein [Burkholderia sp. Ac-20349]|uniref:hypothetical protein n=1 Tax=Burkholderia sp. Ac-20349 TaxID=2703893 RepID=UPI00197BC44E|nr:hypothetical protein [Burkholderia sp. Ac-20349]MBN3840460.1 hypothetical protein [Burkholderia sp. Ac-20349]
MIERTVQAFALSERAASDYLYLLLDPMAECDPENPLSITSLTQTLGEQAITRVLRPDLAHTPEACPALVQLASPGEFPMTALLAASERYAREDASYKKRYVCGWLLSQYSPDVLVDHLVLRCVDIASASTQSVSPWFEPLRLELLFASAGNIFPDLMWPIRRWLCPTSWGTCTVFRGEATGSGLDIPALVRQTQRAVPLINDFLDVWRLALRFPMAYAPWRWRGDTLLPPQAAVHAFRLVRHARECGLRLSADIIDLCTHRVFIHPALPLNPDVQADIACATAGQSTLQARFETYDDPAWMRIVASLPKAVSYS